MANSDGFYHEEGEETEGSFSETLKKREERLSRENAQAGTAGRLSRENEQAGRGALDRGGLYRAEGMKHAGFTSNATKLLAGTTPAGKALALLSRNRKKAAAGGLGFVGLIVSIVSIFGLIAAHELDTIEKDLIGYEDKAVAYVVKKASQSILSSAYCRSLSGDAAAAAGCKTPNEDEGVSDDEADAGQEKAAQDSADPVADMIDGFKFTDPAIVQDLASQNISVEQSDKQVRLRDNNTGKLITYDDLDNPEMVARFQSAIPDFDVGQIKAMEGMLTLDEGADWNPIPSPDDPNADEDIVKDVDGTAENEASQIAEAQSEDEVTKNEKPSQVATSEQLADENNKVIQDADKYIEAGDPEPIVLQKTEADVAPDLGKTFNVSAIVSMLCSIARVATKSAANRDPTIYAFEVRHMSTLASVTDEEKVPGKVSGKQFSDVTQLFNGDPSIKANKDDQTLEESKDSFDQAASWQRISGNPVNSNPKSAGYNPDFDPTLLPVKNAGDTVVDNINHVLSLTGGKYLCDLVENSVFGFISSFVGIVFTATTDISTLGASQIFFSGALISAQEATQHVIIPEILKYFTPVGMDGRENSVQWMNNSDAGSNIAFNMFMQRLGGTPQSTTSAAALYSQGTKLADMEEQDHSFMNRMFAFSNPESLVSRLAVELPMTKIDMIDSIFSDILSSPAMVIHSFGSLFGEARVLADQPTDPGAPYDLLQMGFKNSNITKYDAVSNGQFLNKTVIPYVGNTKTIIQLLGDPNQYPNGTPDPSTTDLLHCFAEDGSDGSSSFLWAQQSDQSGPDPICGTMGNLSTDSSPVGITAKDVANNVICPEIGTANAACDSFVQNYIDQNDIITRYSQYILDDEVTGWLYDSQSTQS